MRDWRFSQKMIEEYINSEHELMHSDESDKPKVRKMRKHREDTSNGSYDGRNQQKKKKKRRKNNSY